jgi:hypothetical protein
LGGFSALLTLTIHNGKLRATESRRQTPRTVAKDLSARSVISFCNGRGPIGEPPGMRFKLKAHFKMK